MEFRPGDVIVTSSKNFFAFLIKLGSLLTGRPALHNHVIVFSHTDAHGTRWGIEAKAGGVGWIDIDSISLRYAWSNVDQSKTDEQRKSIVEVAKGMLGTPYDYSAVVEIGMDAIHADRYWAAKEWGSNSVPAQVICSALADWVYSRVGLASPRKGRFTTPADWADFIEEKGWE